MYCSMLVLCTLFVIGAAVAARNEHAARHTCIHERMQAHVADHVIDVHAPPRHRGGGGGGGGAAKRQLAGAKLRFKFDMRYLTQNDGHTCYSNGASVTVPHEGR